MENDIGKIDMFCQAQLRNLTQDEWLQYFQFPGVFEHSSEKDRIAELEEENNELTQKLDEALYLLGFVKDEIEGDKKLKPMCAAIGEAIERSFLRVE